jgi:hypothetical protein
LTVLLPVLTVLFVLDTGNENEISDVDAESVIFVLSELSFVVQVDEMNLSSPASFSSSFLELEDFLTLVSASTSVVLSAKLSAFLNTSNEGKGSS